MLIASAATIAQDSQPAPRGGMMGPGMGGMMGGHHPGGMGPRGMMECPMTGGGMMGMMMWVATPRRWPA